MPHPCADSLSFSRQTSCGSKELGIYRINEAHGADIATVVPMDGTYPSASFSHNRRSACLLAAGLSCCSAGKELAKPIQLPCLRCSTQPTRGLSSVNRNPTSGYPVSIATPHQDIQSQPPTCRCHSKAPGLLPPMNAALCHSSHVAGRRLPPLPSRAGQDERPRRGACAAWRRVHLQRRRVCRLRSQDCERGSRGGRLGAVVRPRRGRPRGRGHRSAAAAQVCAR